MMLLLLHINGALMTPHCKPINLQFLIKRTEPLSSKFCSYRILITDPLTDNINLNTQILDFLYANYLCKYESKFNLPCCYPK